MINDTHIHIGDGPVDPKGLRENLKQAGVAKAVLLSQRPASFRGAMHAGSPQARLDNLFAWCADDPDLVPFYWIDPTETDALAQVDVAVSRGVTGFKVICDHFYPGEKYPLRTFSAIAEAGKPILFHSGILWDGKPSSNYSRPANFEALLEVRNIRFALAHISWPWVDECIAVYGKLAAAKRYRPDLNVEMFIDTTPGTPPIYRREALTKLFTVGYDVADNVMFGSDNHAEDYNAQYCQDWQKRDRAILDELKISQKVQQAVFADNLLRFLG